METIGIRELELMNGCGSDFWSDLGDALGYVGHLGAAWQKCWDARARYEYGISYEDLYKLKNR